MKKIILKIMLLLIVCGCNLSSNEKLEFENKTLVKTTFEYIDVWNQIELTQTDDKYGEWGGDTDVITIYSNGKTRYVNYARYLGSDIDLEPPKEYDPTKKWYENKDLDLKIDSIELDRNLKQLVHESIIELINHKTHSPSAPSHSGIRNSVVSRDSAIVIIDFPSSNWTSFQKLKSTLTSR